MMLARDAVHHAENQTPNHAAYSIAHDLDRAYGFSTNHPPRAEEEQGARVVPLERVQEIIEALLEARTDHARDEEESWKTTVADLDQEAEKANAQISDLEGKLSDAEDEVADLEAELERAQAQLCTAAEERDAARADAEGLQKQIAELARMPATLSPPRKPKKLSWHERDALIAVAAPTDVNGARVCDLTCTVYKRLRDQGYLVCDQDRGQLTDRVKLTETGLARVLSLRLPAFLRERIRKNLPTDR